MNDIESQTDIFLTSDSLIEILPTGGKSYNGKLWFDKAIQVGILSVENMNISRLERPIIVGQL